MNSKPGIELSFHLILAFADTPATAAADARRSIEAAAATFVEERGWRVQAAHCGIDHFHLLVALDEGTVLSKCIRLFKAAITKSARGSGVLSAHALWQPGYFVLSSSLSDRAETVARICGQDALHENCSFRDEVLQLVDAAGISPRKRLPFLFRDGGQTAKTLPSVLQNTEEEQ